jgi:4-hydroxythreonine-4-phosphate dehydrogenase
MRPKIAFTVGDPAGVGPEICLKAARDPRVLEICEPVMVGALTALEAASELLGVPIPENVEDVGGLERSFLKGRVSAECGLVAYRSLMRGIEMALSDEVDAIVTAPLNKAALNLAGIHENGHTEILAKATMSPSYALMLTSERLTCAFVTCHQSLGSVPGSLNIPRVLEVIRLLDGALRSMTGNPPRIGLLALNPHAGEEGLFGREEIEVLMPAVEAARDRGFQVSDPIPPDTAFLPGALSRYDGYVCLYHDQGGIPFKMLSFEDGVNTTLGLPIIRTSVDHGTAFDIAWEGIAAHSSMVAAVELAVRLIQRQTGH